MNQDLQSAHEADQSQKNGTTHGPGQFMQSAMHLSMTALQTFLPSDMFLPSLSGFSPDLG
jgi:hypothetical protein